MDSSVTLPLAIARECSVTAPPLLANPVAAGGFMLENVNSIMKPRYRLFRRGWGTYYSEDLQTRKQESLREPR